MTVQNEICVVIHTRQRFNLKLLRSM